MGTYLILSLHWSLFSFLTALFSLLFPPKATHDSVRNSLSLSYPFIPFAAISYFSRSWPRKTHFLSRLPAGSGQSLPLASSKFCLCGTARNEIAVSAVTAKCLAAFFRERMQMQETRRLCISKWPCINKTLHSVESIAGVIVPRWRKSADTMSVREPFSRGYKESVANVKRQEIHSAARRNDFTWCLFYRL